MEAHNDFLHNDFLGSELFPSIVVGEGIKAVLVEVSN